MTNPGATARRSGELLLTWGLLVAAANLRAPLTGVGPVLDQIQADLGLPATVAGLLTTLPLLAFAGLSPLVPRLTVRHSPERVLAWALVVLAIGVALRWAPTAPGLFAGTTLIGAGAAVGNVLLPSLIKRDFPTRVGLLTAAYATIMGGIAAVASGVAVPLSEVAPGGWRGLPHALACRVVVGRWAGERSKAARADGDQPAPLGGHAGCAPDGQHPGPRAARARRRHRDVAAGASESMDGHSGSRRLAERLEQPVVHADVLALHEGRRPDLPGRDRRARTPVAADSRLSTLRGCEATKLRTYEVPRPRRGRVPKRRTCDLPNLRGTETTNLRECEIG